MNRNLTVLELSAREDTKYMLKRLLLRAGSPIFAALMRVAAFRSWVANFHTKHPDAHFLRRLLMPFYSNWYGKNVRYDSKDYSNFQAHYWNTVGQMRWASKFDYSDTLEALQSVSKSAKTLIDIGCGNGAMLDEISRKFPHLRLFGIDVSDRMCQTAKRNAPQAQIHCGPYGRQSGLAGTFDHVVARSTLTYVDEADIQNILTWLASITNMVLLISEPNGGDDAEHICTGQLDIAVLGDGVYKRLYDHTHIRQYSRYQLTGLKLVHTAKELAHGGGNTQWLFVRESAQTTLSGS